MSGTTIDELEREVGESLAQIRASVDEYVKVMRECAAQVRHESLEANFKHDKTLKALNDVSERATAVLTRNTELANKFHLGWPKAVEDGVRAAAQEYAKVFVEANLKEAKNGLSESAEQVRVASKTLSLRTALVAGIGSAVTVCVLLWWAGLIGSGLDESVIARSLSEAVRNDLQAASIHKAIPFADTH